MPSLRLHAKKLGMPASLSTRDFLSARSSRPTLQVLADTGRLLRRLRVRHGHQWQRNWSRDCRPATDTSASGCHTQRQLRTWSTSARQDDARQPSRRSHLCECPAPSLRAHAAHASGTSIPYPYPMTLTRQQASATCPTRCGIYIGRPPRSHLITPTAASHRRRCIARAVQGARQRSWALRACMSHDAHDGMRHGMLMARRVEPGRSESAASCQRQAMQRHAWQPIILAQDRCPASATSRGGWVRLPDGSAFGQNVNHSSKGAPTACRGSNSPLAHALLSYRQRVSLPLLQASLS